MKSDTDRHRRLLTFCALVPLSSSEGEAVDSVARPESERMWSINSQGG